MPYGMFGNVPLDDTYRPDPTMGMFAQNPETEKRKQLKAMLSDPAELAKLAGHAKDSTIRGAIAGLFGAPVDIINSLANYSSPSSSKAIKENPVGGSEWIGQKMQDYGIVSDYRNAPAELIAGVGLDPSIAGAKLVKNAPDVGKAVSGMFSPDPNTLRMGIGGESKAMSVDEIGKGLYKLNKLAKAYGTKGSNIYRVADPIKQNKIYELKDKILQQYGENTGELHKLINGYGELYKIGEHSFHRPTDKPWMIQNQLISLLKENNIPLSAKVDFGDIVSPVYEDLETFKKYRDEYRRLQEIAEKKVSDRIKSIWNNDVVVPPRNIKGDTDITMEEEAELLSFLKSKLGE